MCIFENRTMVKFRPPLFSHSFYSDRELSLIGVPGCCIGTRPKWMSAS